MNTTCVDSALGQGLDPHGAAFGPPVLTQELERSKPKAYTRKHPLCRRQVGEFPNIKALLKCMAPQGQVPPTLGTGWRTQMQAWLSPAGQTLSTSSPTSRVRGTHTWGCGDVGTAGSLPGLQQREISLPSQCWI